MKRQWSKIVLWTMVCTGLSLVAGANAHLVYVALASQPDCVAHSRAADGSHRNAKYVAARSSCNPQIR